MLPNSGKLHPITAMDITNRIIVALLERMKSRNKNFSLSRPKFHRLFQINPDGYLWYGKKLERHLLNKYGESADTLKYLDMYYFIDNIVRLYYMPKNSNSEENEFGKLYAYGSIIGLHRCHIPDKRIYLNRLLNTLLFCCPTSEEYIRRFRWQKKRYILQIAGCGSSYCRYIYRNTGIGQTIRIH